MNPYSKEEQEFVRAARLLFEEEVKDWDDREIIEFLRSTHHDYPQALNRLKRWLERNASLQQAEEPETAAETPEPKLTLDYFVGKTVSSIHRTYPNTVRVKFEDSTHLNITASDLKIQGSKIESRLEKWYVHHDID